MVSLTVSCVVDARAVVGEGPIWDVAQQVLWWTDIKGRIVHRFDPATGADRAFGMPIRVGCMALRRNGGFVLAAEHGFWFWWPQEDRLEHIVDVEAGRPDNRMNDGACDRQGRFVVSSMNLAPDKQPSAACWRLDTSLRVVQLAEGLTIGNGIAFSPAGDRFYLADTQARRVWQHRYSADGELGERMDFLDTAGLAGKPDGATVDAEGFYWLAGVYGGQLYRIAPDGRIDRSIDLPISTPTCARFGGKDMADLYVTSMGESLPGPAGGLFVVRGLGVRGLPEPLFGG